MMATHMYCVCVCVRVCVCWGGGGFAKHKCGTKELLKDDTKPRESKFWGCPKGSCIVSARDIKILLNV
jgi:hypothetical protein